MARQERAFASRCFLAALAPFLVLPLCTTHAVPSGPARSRAWQGFMEQLDAASKAAKGEGDGADGDSALKMLNEVRAPSGSYFFFYPHRRVSRLNG